MNLLYVFAAALIALFAGLTALTRFQAWSIERRNPPVGDFADISGTRLHFVHVPAPAGADLPPIVFIHGASANLKDQMVPLRAKLEERAELLFFDRPGHGWSARGPKTQQTPFDQADLLAGLMDKVGIRQAIIVGHSFGGAVEAAFALDHPERVRGLVFLSPATHPWPGAATSWYYTLAARPVIGRLFAETIATPAGARRIEAATTCVFAPNPVPERYVQQASIDLVLRPAAFRDNARDVEGLHAFTLAAQPRYRDIRKPTVVISGNRDTVVAEEIHSIGLERDIPGAELVWVPNMGHKPEWVASDLVTKAIEKVAGNTVDLRGTAEAVAARLAKDDAGPACEDTKFPVKELAPQQ